MDFVAAPDARASWFARNRYTLATFLLTLPLLAALGTSMWRTPFPLNETVALLEDVEVATHREIFDPAERAWFRPLYFETWLLLWRGTGSLDRALAGFKAIEVAAPVLLVLLLVWHLRPRTRLEAGAAICAVAVLVGSPGFRENLEIPLLMTLVGMPMALMVWMLVTREPRPWHGAAVLLLTAAAIGFKEQGLVIVPVVAAAWWTRAPGAGTRLTVTLIACTMAYLAWRLALSANWPVFEQSVGLGFEMLEPPEAIARFGDFPYWMYAYNGLSTMLNVLFSEPTAGRYNVVLDTMLGRVEPWQILHLVSSAVLTAMIVWWSARVVPGLGRSGWTPEARVALAFAVSLLASAALSFNYSRDRLGGMAAVFYALAAYHAICYFTTRIAASSALPRARLAFAASLLILVAAAWQIRAIGTVEWTRRMSELNTIVWLTETAPRRVEFADRPRYLEIMTRMFPQGTDPDAPRQTNYPPFIWRLLGPPALE